MRVLVVGGGAREHALVRALRADPSVSAVIAAPGNAGTAAEVENRPLDVADPATVAELAFRLAVDLVVVGPEGPLVAGVADAVRAQGIACFGPSAAAAALEGSKAFAKDVMARAGVPTARARVCSTPEEAAGALDELGSPYVVKDDGLAAGKGVVVTTDRDEALAHAASCERVVVEEYLDGPEVSLFALCDGTTVLPLVPAQDFKRVGDGDQGPNTGGMGAYSPLPWAPDGLVDAGARRRAAADGRRDGPARHAVRRPAVRRAGADVGGRAGHRVQRAVRRPGDPGGAGPAAHPAGRAAARRRHRDAARRAAAGVVRRTLRSRSWWPRTATRRRRAPATRSPASTRPGRSRARRCCTPAPSCDVSGRVISSGGRVLSVVGTGADLAAARSSAYAAVDRITLPGSHHRTDIAAAAADTTPTPTATP